MAQLEDLVQIENGPRYAQTATYKGQPIEVATGYNPTQDNWTVHVYITKGGEKSKQTSSSTNNKQEAFDWGFAFARQVIDQGF